MSTAPAATTSTSAPATGIGFDEMQAFVTGYYALLPGRPQDAWPKLDAGYQQRAGWSGYRDFWASIRSVSVTSIAVAAGVDPEALRTVARERFQVSLSGGLGPLAGRVFRIGHIAKGDKGCTVHGSSESWSARADWSATHNG